jgi:RNA polymerase sigma-70 factor (ECF subfamily)
MNRTYRGLFEGWEIAIAVKLVREFQHRWRPLALEPTEDLLQDCLIHWLAVRRGADPTRSAARNAFMGRVLRNKLMDMVRERESEKRKVNYDAVSLDDLVIDNEDGEELGDRRDGSAGQRQDGEDDVSKQDVRLDLLTVIRHLTPIQQRLCLLVVLHEATPEEISRRLRMTPDATAAELKRIREVFAQFGLDGYLRR